MDDPVLENLKSWKMDDTTRLSGDDHYWKHESGDRRSSDSEMLKTYSTGLLSVCLARKLRSQMMRRLQFWLLQKLHLQSLMLLLLKFQGESQDIKATSQKANEDVDEFFILDNDSCKVAREILHPVSYYFGRVC